jgi:hypothetical protein
MQDMANYTIQQANTYLDQLAADADFAHHAMALRTLISEGTSVAETEFMMRGMFPTSLIAALVEAHNATKTEPAIVA